MLKSIFIIVASVFLTFFCSIMVSAGDEADAFRTAVRNIFDTYSAANIAGDTDSYISLWDEDGIKMGPNKPAVQGRPTIEKLKRKGAQKWNYESQDIKIEETRVAGNWGFARGTYTGNLTSKSGSKTINVDGKYLTIFKRQVDGSWKIFRDCYNSNVPPK